MLESGVVSGGYDVLMLPCFQLYLRQFYLAINNESKIFCSCNNVCTQMQIVHLFYKMYVLKHITYLCMIHKSCHLCLNLV